MKVLLLNPPYKDLILRENYCCHTSKGDYVWAPTDLLYVSGILDSRNFEVSAIDAVVENYSHGGLIEDIKFFNPDTIICLTGTLSFQGDIKLLEQVCDHIDCNTYLMGNYPAFHPKEVLLNHRIIDGVFHNFFDVEIEAFLLKRHGHFKSISYRDESGSLITGSINYLDKGELPNPPPPRYELFPIHKYSTPVARKRPLATVVTAFGCPYSCKFCVASELNLYFRSLANIQEEFDAIKEYGIREIFFTDSTFNASIDRLRSICNLMIDKGYGFSWSCNIHSLSFSAADFALMKRAGCHTIQVGVESVTEESRAEFAPTKRLDKLKEAFRLAHDSGLKTLAYFIIGFPNETKSEVERNIEFAIELDPYFASFTTLIPDVGTRFAQEAAKSGMINDDFVAVDNSGSAMEMQHFKLSKQERQQLIRKAYRRFYLRPRQLLKYASDFEQYPVLISNGLNVLRKYT